jgi:REP element-mobilizing transposase RayT
MRKSRELEPGARYHVTLQADKRLTSGRDEAMRELFKKTLARAASRHSFRVDIFCMLGNQFHLLIKPDEGESLSRIMQWIMTVYAIGFHRMAGSCGHVWDRRFDSKIVGRERGRAAERPPPRPRTLFPDEKEPAEADVAPLIIRPEQRFSQVASGAQYDKGIFGFRAHGEGSP